MEEEQTLTLTSEAEREPEKDEATAMSDSSNDSDSDSDDEAQQNIQLQSLETELAANPANYDAHLQVIPISLLLFSCLWFSNFEIFASWVRFCESISLPFNQIILTLVRCLIHLHFIFSI